jgi:hypothetical protein
MESTSSTNHPKGCQNKFGIIDNKPYLCGVVNSVNIQNLFHMLHSTTQRKKAQMASALFNDVQFLSMDCIRNTAEWDALTCDEQMRLEDLIATA